MGQMTRREVFFSAAATAAAFGLGGRLSLLGTAHAQTAMDRGFHRYTVGSIEVTALYDGVWEKAHDPGFITNASVDETKAALAAASAPALAAAHVPADNGVPLSNEYRPRRAVKSTGSTSSRNVRTGQTDGKG